MSHHAFVADGRDMKGSLPSFRVGRIVLTIRAISRTIRGTITWLDDDENDEDVLDRWYRTRDPRFYIAAGITFVFMWATVVLVLV